MSESARTDTERELLAATKRALAEHGVSDLTTQKIADEWGRAQSLVHYYYDTKADLLVGYVEARREHRREHYAELAGEPPLERLARGPFSAADSDHAGQVPAETAALLELHARAFRNERLLETLNGLEDDAREFAEDAVRDAIDEGVVRDVDPRAAAATLLSAADGAHLRVASLGRTEDGALVDAGLDAYVREVLLTADGRERWDGFEG